jgi:hypothetical protein
LINVCAPNVDQAAQSTYRKCGAALQDLKSRLLSEATPRDLIIGHTVMLGVIYWGLVKQPGWGSHLTGIFLLLVTPALLIIPHELGHALTARLVKFRDVRVVIGVGPPLWVGKVFGFPWVFNRYWVGGWVTFDGGESYSRVNRFAVVAAGPLVNALLMLAIWVGWAPSGLPSVSTVSGVLFWANAILVVENLMPAYVNLGDRRLATDGMQLAQILFADLIRRTSSGPAHQIKKRAEWFLTLVLYSVPALGCLFVSAMFLGQAEDTGAPRLMRTLALCVGGLALPFGYLAARRMAQGYRPDVAFECEPSTRRAWRELSEQSASLKDKEGLALFRTLKFTASLDDKLQILETLLRSFPGDPFILFLKGCYLMQHNRFDEAKVALTAAEQMTATPLSLFLINLAQVEVSALLAPRSERRLFVKSG